MILVDYLNSNLDSIAMIGLCCDNKDLSEDTLFNYNYWTWNKHQNTLYLLKNCYRAGHILSFLESDIIEQPEETSFLVKSKNHPQNYRLNFYFGGAKL